jgi:hypothetical protein
VSTPQTYTITETNEYSTTDGSKRFTFTAGTVIPMSLAIEMGLEGAGYDDPVWFTENQTAAIVDAVRTQGVLSTVDETLAAGAAIVANTVYLAALNSALHTEPIDGLTHVVGGTGGGNVAAGLYTYDGTTFTRVAHSGVVATGAINTAQRLSFTAYTPDPSARLYAGFGSDTGITVSVRTISATVSVISPRAVIKAAAWSSGLPATITAAAAASAIVLQIAD